MAKLAEPDLVFGQGCPDCGARAVELPPPLPGIADDFDWLARDYDSFRLFMMEELAHRFPDRRRWTAADMEVVIVELLAAALDRLSHALDTIHGERFLETARRPGSVRRLLKLIGFDPADEGPTAGLSAAEIERYWQQHPEAMEQARALGPERIREQKRMVTLADHEAILVAHPLVSRARAQLVGARGWTTTMVAVQLEVPGLLLDDPLAAIDPDLWRDVRDWHAAEGLGKLPAAPPPTARDVLRILVERRRMIGTEVLLMDAREVGITFSLSIRARPGYFRSELKHALTQLFDAGAGGLFEPGRQGFGDDVFASDIIAAAMTVEGVETACLNLLKRTGRHPNRAEEGFVPIDRDEIAACLNDPKQPLRGGFRITIHGGLAG